MGSDVVCLVKNRWRGLFDLKCINQTCASLILRCKQPKSLKDFRPISCCNVIYKIISKTLANRLKPLLDRIISVNQSASISGRLITDNALLAFETFHAMKHSPSGKNNAFALKLDMSKAYDRVEWVFLEKVMMRMGFRDNWIRRIMHCITSVSFSFKVNGKICGNVLPSRGLRQGDPISPYLFIMCADAFSRLITQSMSRGLIHGVKVCRGAPSLSHLFFADDSILFPRAAVQECSEVARIISKYERASGQRVNYENTEISFSEGVPESMRQVIKARLGV